MRKSEKQTIEKERMKLHGMSRIQVENRWKAQVQEYKCIECMMNQKDFRCTNFVFIHKNLDLDSHKLHLY